MKNLADILEGIFDLDDVDNNMDDTLVKGWMEKHLSGKYKVTRMKNGTYRFTGDVIISGVQEDNLSTFNICGVSGDLHIENCPNITSLEGLFRNRKDKEINDVPDVTITGLLTITNCKSFNSFDGFPLNINGGLTIMDCPALKNIEGAKKYNIEGDISIVKAGKRWKQNYVKNFFQNATTIMCSKEEEGEVLEESIQLDEALQEPHLLELWDYIKKNYSRITNGGKLTFDNLFPESVEVDKITPSMVKIYYTKDYDERSNGNKLISEILKTTVKEHGVVIVKEIDGGMEKFAYVIGGARYDFPEIFPLNTEALEWSRQRSGYTEIRNKVKRIIPSKTIAAKAIISQILELSYHEAFFKVICITPTSAIFSRMKKQGDRFKSRENMVENTPEYYNKCIAENKKRWKDLLAERRAKKQSGEIDNLLNGVNKLMVRYSKISIKLKDPVWIKSGAEYKIGSTGVAIQAMLKKAFELTKHSNIAKGETKSSWMNASYAQSHADSAKIELGELMLSVDSRLKEMGL